MIIFKYNKKIDNNNWKRLIKNGIKYGHQFPVFYEITEEDTVLAKKKVNEFQLIWNKYDNTFREKIFYIYNYKFPKHINCYINSSPYSSFNIEKKYLSISIKCKKNRLVPTILHEANHFLFRKYYDNYCFSIGCSKKDIDNIKELITIINDDVFCPMQDNGWKIHQKFRKKVLNVWKKTKNIKTVINYAKKIIDKNKKIFK